MTRSKAENYIAQVREAKQTIKPRYHDAVGVSIVSTFQEAASVAQV